MMRRSNFWHSSTSTCLKSTDGMFAVYTLGEVTKDNFLVWSLFTIVTACSPVTFFSITVIEQVPPKLTSLSLLQVYQLQNEHFS